MADTSVALLGGETHEETKEERIEKARETVKSIQKKDSEETRFRPASTLQKKKIYGYRDEEGWHKGIIESRYITKAEIREIGSPDKLSVEVASDWLGLWWGVGDEVGERAKRELDAQNKKDSKIETRVEGDKSSLAKDILVDEVNALRRENFLIDDERFEKEMGYNPTLEELTEKELTKLKEILQHYHPKEWNGGSE